jgi:hypothetical protein
MGLVKVLVCFTLYGLVCAQSGVDPAAPDAVSVNGLSNVERPTSPVSVNGLSNVARPTGDTLSMQPLSVGPGPFLSWATENSPPTATAASASGKKSSGGKIAGGVVGGLAVIVAAICALVFLRLRNRRSKTHWRNRTGLWQDQEGKGGPVYVGQSVGPFDGYRSDLKVPAASPTTTGPVFIRQPIRGRTRGSLSSHNRNDSMEMHGNLGSPITDATRF